MSCYDAAVTLISLNDSCNCNVTIQGKDSISIRIITKFYLKYDSYKKFDGASFTAQ